VFVELFRSKMYRVRVVGSRCREKCDRKENRKLRNIGKYRYYGDFDKSFLTLNFQVTEVTQAPRKSDSNAKGMTTTQASERSQAICVILRRSNTVSDKGCVTESGNVLLFLISSPLG
jgi:hypothetical protein